MAASVIESSMGTVATDDNSQPNCSELAEEDFSSRDGNADDTEGEGEEVDGEIVSDIEFILPREVIESCVSLKAGGESSFWSVNKEAQTSSQLTLQKRDDESVKIRVTVVVLGDAVNPDSNDKDSSRSASVLGENGVVENLNSSDSSERQPVENISLSDMPSSEITENSKIELTEASTATTADSSGVNKDLGLELPIAESCVVDVLKASVSSDRGDGVSANSHSDGDVNGNIEAAEKSKSGVTLDSLGNGSRTSSDVDTVMSGSGTTVIIVKHVSRNLSTRDMDTQTDIEVTPSVAVATVVVNTVTAPTLVAASAPPPLSKPASASATNTNGAAPSAVGNSRDIAERLKAREALRRATESRNQPQQSINRAGVTKLYGGKVQSARRVVPPVSTVAAAVVRDSVPVVENNDVWSSDSAAAESVSTVSGQKSALTSVNTGTTDTLKTGTVSGSTSEADKLSCDLCGDVSDGGYIALIRHVKRKHTDCTFVRTYIDELRVLQAEAHKCPVCRKGFPTGGALSAHIRACHGSIEWMRAVGGTGGNISSGNTVKNSSGSQAVTKANQALSKGDGEATASEPSASKGSKSTVTQSVKKDAGAAVDKKLRAVTGNNVTKKTDNSSASKAKAIVTNNSDKTLRGKRKLSEAIVENVNSSNKKAKVTKITTSVEPASKQGATKSAAVGSVRQQQRKGQQEKGTDVRRSASAGKDDSDEKGAGKKPSRQQARRFVCDLCSQVFTTSTVLATHMRYCKTDRGSV